MGAPSDCGHLFGHDGPLIDLLILGRDKVTPGSAHAGRGHAAELSAWFLAAADAPAVKPKLAVLGLSPVRKCGGPFSADLLSLYEEYGQVIQAANIKAE
jgi:hypothetical protein